jgi:hypothetical protein
MFLIPTLFLLIITISNFINGSPNLKVSPKIWNLFQNYPSCVKHELGHCSSNGKVCGWFGIPYAQPPVGDLRFRKPVPMGESWKDKYIKNEMPPACQQYNNPAENVLVGFSGPKSEDCLYLNIWTPCCKGNCRLPVLVRS